MMCKYTLSKKKKVKSFFFQFMLIGSLYEVKLQRENYEKKKVKR